VRPPDPVVILDCGHVEFKRGKCATTDCPNFIGLQKALWFSMALMVALLAWVRLVTGRGAIEIIMDALPALPGVG
jgi:hypothetical protein